MNIMYIIFIFSIVFHFGFPLKKTAKKLCVRQMGTSHRTAKIMANRAGNMGALSNSASVHYLHTDD